MAKVSLADLRSGARSAALPERAYQLCIRRDLLARTDSLVDELQSALSAAQMKSGPFRVGEQPESPRVQEIRAELGDLYDEMDDATGELVLRAVPDGVWRRWVNTHPAVEGDQRDEQVAYGLCSADALAGDLGTYAVSWNGEPLADGDWDLLAPNISGGDLKQLVAIVVQLQEAVEDPKLRRLVSLGAPTSNAAEPSPARLADPPPSSTDESRPSDTSTTTETTT